ncbi:PHD finger domain [Pyrenophora seminiperda CCB06]|uniref:PHD finger domain n=1 Tax=Pyrenophora seminiperda CCB06 TaxID=1302712 RepID=A0A3M7M8S0_9PLEO|nr:PHD finger domain [Pyrenophora seminiperda CCB06]
MFRSTDWHIQSPSSTPKSLTIADASFKTPKTEPSPHSHFLDAWATPLPNGQHTPVQTPSFTLSTPIDRPLSSYSQSVRTPEDPDFHVNHFAPQNLPLPPVDVSRRLSSSPDPNKLTRVGRNPLLCREALRPVTMDFSHMQTPPPTRDASSRRAPPQRAANGVGTPATVIHRTPVQVPCSEALFDQTPFDFGNLQYTSDLMQFPSLDPTSAPPLPQSRLFWDSSNDGMQMDLDAPLGINSFDSTPHRVEQNMNWPAFNHQGTDSMQTPAFHSFQASPGLMSISNPHTEQGHISRHNLFGAASTSVDPIMLFSAYNPDMTTSPVTLPPQPTTRLGLRQPYETQLRDAQAEREQVKRARSQHSRSNTNSSSGSAENVKPGLQRSNTDGMMKKTRPLATDSRTAMSANLSTIPRRPSPLKRQSGGSTKPILETRKPRTRLIIDETGRARTETVSAEHGDDCPRAIRQVLQPDPRRQYPGLYEQEDSGSEEDEPAPVLSRNTSFNIPQPERRAPKHARTDSGGFEGGASFKVARPASRTSGAFDVASFQSARLMRASTTKHACQRCASVDYSRECEIHSPGDALGALKKVVGERQQRIERASQNTLRAHNQRWAQASAEISNVTPPDTRGLSLGQYDPFTNTFNGSPTTTPTTDRSSLSSESTRCICNSVADDDSALMLQCESCNKWLHMGCLGLSKGALPQVYVCIFCTGQTPIARGGRLRGPIPFDSPLNYKTMFRG